MNQMIVDRLLPIVEAYAAGRELQKALWREIRALRCERLEEGLGPCYNRVPEPCDTCAKKSEVYVRFKRVRAEARNRRGRIEALGLRLSLPDVAEPDAPRPLLDLMGAEGSQP